MKRLKYFTVVISALLLFLCFFLFSSKNPSFTLSQQQLVILAELKNLQDNSSGKSLTSNTDVYILHFWASWCGPCKEELPTIIEARNHLPTNIRLILISEDDQANAALEFLRPLAATLPADFHYWDSDKALAKSLNIQKFPETLVFDKQHRLIRKISGAMNWMDPKNLSYFKSLQ